MDYLVGSPPKLELSYLEIRFFSYSIKPKYATYKLLFRQLLQLLQGFGKGVGKHVFMLFVDIQVYGDTTYYTITPKYLPLVRPLHQDGDTLLFRGRGPEHAVRPLRHDAARRSSRSTRP